jgi:predicted MFS family arabinose efflux permease
MAMTALASANGSYFGPAISASIPDLVSARQVPAATSVMQSSFQISNLAGQAAGGALFQWLGAPVLFLVNAVSFWVAAASEFFIKMPPPAKQAGGKHSFRKETNAGVRYVWSTSGLRATVIGSSLLGFFAVPVQILFPFFVDDFLKAGASWYGYILAAQGVGSLVGLVLAGSVPLKGPGRGRCVLVCMLAQPLGIWVLAMLRHPGATVALAFGGGVLAGFVAVSVNAILQCNTPREYRGRVFGAVRSIGAAASPLAMGLAGIAADALDKNIPLIYQFCGASMLVTACLLAFNRQFRGYVSQEFRGDPREEGYA